MFVLLAAYTAQLTTFLIVDLQSVSVRALLQQPPVFTCANGACSTDSSTHTHARAGHQQVSHGRRILVLDGCGLGPRCCAVAAVEQPWPVAAAC